MMFWSLNHFIGLSWSTSANLNIFSYLKRLSISNNFLISNIFLISNLSLFRASLFQISLISTTLSMLQIFLYISTEPLSNLIRLDFTLEVIFCIYWLFIFCFILFGFYSRTLFGCVKYYINILILIDINI